MVWTKRLTVIIAMSTVLGCSVSGPRRPPLPDTGPTILDIYQGTRGTGTAEPNPATGSSSVRARMPLRDAAEFNPGPIRLSAQDQIERRFARVPNPDMVMYVFPHLQNKHPVPGYFTMFPMYTTTEYLLPGEVAERGNAR